MIEWAVGGVERDPLREASIKLFQAPPQHH